MALDLKNMDRKKAAITIFAIVAGLIAVILMNQFIEDRIARIAATLNKGPSKEDLQTVMQRVQGLEQENQQLIATVRNLAAQRAAAPAQAEATKPKPAMLLSMATPPGKRAITVNVDKLAAVGGLVNPGDFVDVIIHLRVPADPFNAEKTERTTVTLFQNVQVLALGTSLEPLEEGAAKVPPTVPITLALDPQEASLMSFAQKNGDLQLILRSPVEKQAFILPAATWESLSDYIQETQDIDIGLWGQMEETEEEPRFEEPPPAPEIQIFRGGL